MGSKQQGNSLDSIKGEGRMENVRVEAGRKSNTVMPRDLPGSAWTGWHGEFSETGEKCMLSLVYWRVMFGVKVSLKVTEDAVEQE